ncbi:hypothetical protein GCM10023210_44450 [Chryseobacterium ginsengisoli]|uniref:DUF6705 domain-containing protein n=1 Tax=Chryseobacterium ginsengisoli TaxID=363853 RepID=A0ABP9N1E4_9FLAO
MKYLLFILTTFFISCNAQTVSLETEAQCYENPNCPEYTYAKDINNSLQKYLGIWKGNLNGNLYEIKLSNGLYEDFGIKRDRLIGRLRITDLYGNTIYSSFTESDDQKTHFAGLGFSKDLQHYMMRFSGPGVPSCINRGTIYLNMNTTDLTKMSFIYLLSYDITNGECPSTFVSTIPQKQRIYLTKQ